MADISGDVLARLQQNIQSTLQDSTIPLETRLFDEAELVLPKQLQGPPAVPVIQSLVALLATLQQDPTPAVNLLLKLLEPFSYTDIISLGTESLPWTDGLVVGEHMVSYNRLMLTLLEKATTKPSDAAHVASMLDTMLALVKLWLCTSDTGIASQASRLLIDLLRIDREIVRDPDAPVPSGGQGMVWKRIFGDRNVYGAIFEAASLTGPSKMDLSKNQRTLAQARLMEWLPTVGAMDWSAISRNHHEDVEKAYGVKESGLLEFATLRMVDYKDDVLMHRCLVDFYSDLLKATKDVDSAMGSGTNSPALRYLIAQGVHARTVAIYLQPPGTPVDPVESMFLYGPAANYIATYASSYSDHFIASQLPKQVIERLRHAFDLSPAKWAHADSPKHDLHVAASLPRAALLPSGPATWSTSPVSLLPSRSTNPDVLNTLATLFHGPEKRILTFPAHSSLPTNQDDAEAIEAAAARSLYYSYITANPRFWQDIATHADTVALKDLALSAINVFTAVITANWSTKPDMPLPATVATPGSGHLAILSPPALEYALPYLLKPPQTFSNLVGGRGDTESAAYKIAAAKFDALRLMHGRVAEEVQRRPGEGFEDILRTLGKRLAEGPLSREGEVGGRVGTLEL